jgi:hypothetical protein
MKKECCPRFNPKKWNKIHHKWKDKLFIKESMPTFLHIPFPWIVGKKITRLCKMAENAKVELAPLDALLLFHDSSAFRSEIYLSVKKTVKDAKNISVSSSFFSRVFEGSYSSVPKFMKQMNRELKEKNLFAKDYYIHYAYCPKCAKKYGNNYIVIFAELDENI